MSLQEQHCRVVHRSGTVTACDTTHVEVEIEQPGACASCHIKALCATGGAVVRRIHAAHDGSLRPGMAVTVSMEERFGWYGVVAGFVLPLLLLVAVLFGTRPHVAREEIAGLLALLSLVPYYWAVHAARHHIARIVYFTARKEGTT